MSEHRKIPSTVVTGFLGAGKTTLIRHLLETANGKRLALIINEFGDIGIDGEVLKACGNEDCGEEDILELANGCLCCTVADDFVPTIEGLLARDPLPDHIVIETSGLALPKPLVSAFGWPEIRTRLTVDGVVAVVDGPALDAGVFAADPDAVLVFGDDGDGVKFHEIIIIYHAYAIASLGVQAEQGWGDLVRKCLLDRDSNLSSHA